MAIMQAPESGVKVRMYRQGHGDCFLLAFPKQSGGAFYMLIDCGMCPGSQTHKDTDKEVDIKDVVKDIKSATNGHLDLVVITHEHLDHVSGFSSAKSTFESMTIDRCWLAWTEDDTHPLANELRDEYNDTLLGLAAATFALKAHGTDEEMKLVDRMESRLLLDTGGPFAAASIPGIKNKNAIKFIRDKAEANKGTQCLRPHRKPSTLDEVENVRIFVLGPPENKELLEDPDPRSGEGYHFSPMSGEGRAFSAAAHDLGGNPFSLDDAAERVEQAMPFAEKYRLDPRSTETPARDSIFFKKYYGLGAESGKRHEYEWRRIDIDWLHSAEQLGLRMNNYTNNTTLVLAIELAKNGNVLLFAGDAQRGNWVSWDDKKWTSSNGLAGGEVVTVENLLNRTVVYKVGHHGSHNATLKADGLEKMGLDEYASEFMAFIPANSVWAYGKSSPWEHPLKSIKEALRKKARGRILQINTDSATRPNNVSKTEWKRFTDRANQSKLYHEYTVPAG